MPDESDAAVMDAPADGGAVALPGADNQGELDFGYQVTIDSFSGPMDLLLYLVRRAEVDIADIPIGQIADQFVDMLQATPDLDLDIAGDFILMAATLLELKSRLVVPPQESEQNDNAEGDDDLIDPRAGLVRQLLAYRRFKEATQLLPNLEHLHEQRHERRFREIIPEDQDEIDGLDLTNCQVGLLYDNFEMILVRINRLGPRTVINDDVPLETKIHALIDNMRAARESTMQHFFSKEKTVSGRVGIVMATLECARQRFIEARQFEQFGDVLLRYREDEERTRVPDELPPEAEDLQKKRRRRPPLVTWRPPERSDEPEQQEIDLPELEEEAVVETDEQRFLRELEESCAVTAVLTRTADLETSFVNYQAELQAAAEAAAAAAAAAAEALAQRAAERRISVAELAAIEAAAAAAAAELQAAEAAVTPAADAAENKSSPNDSTTKKKSRSKQPRKQQSKSEANVTLAQQPGEQTVDLIISSDEADDSEFDADADTFFADPTDHDGEETAPDQESSDSQQTRPE